MLLERRSRIEIVIEAGGLPELLRAVGVAGAPGYTLLREASGTGSHGPREGGDVADLLTNDVVIILADPAAATAILEAVAGVLELYAGKATIGQVEQLVSEPGPDEAPG
jgi:hypothetical protein